MNRKHVEQTPWSSVDKVTTPKSPSKATLKPQMSVNAPYRPVTQGAKMFDLVSQAIKADRAYMSSEV